MRLVTFGAILAEVVFYDDLLEPFRPRNVGLVASDTMAARRLVRLDIGIVCMIPAYAMATLTGLGPVRIRR